MTVDREVSSAQRKVWVLDRLHPGTAAYTVPLVYRIDGDLDLAVLERSLSEIVRRHDILRTVYRVRSGGVRQVALPAQPVSIPVVDVSGHEDPPAEARRLAAAESRRPFDLACGPVMRPLLLRSAPGRHLLCLTLHHIACDGWSLHVLERELSTCYRSWRVGRAPELPPLPEQYADFAEWQAARIADPALRPTLDHWRRRLADVPAPATLPADRPRPPVQSFAGGHVRFTVEPPVAERVGLLARACRATPFAVLLAAYAALVHVRGGGAEAVIGAPVTSRRRESDHRLIGMFVNTVVHRVDVSGAPTFRELVHRARDESRSAMAHRAAPFELLVEELNPVRDPGFNPLFQLMLGYQEAEESGLVLPGCEVERKFGDTATAKVDLSLTMTRDHERYTGRLEYNSDLFEATTAHSIAEQFRTLLATGTADPQLGIGTLGHGPGHALRNA
ncbi:MULTISPECIES: condensation domain-containing protein [unclassified Streptomyces]|uniref:condensation domain-containing protein n=1 Tax=unclassified Streptomyces TaxID=2593676 RepID=UPI0023656442|nr:MULTISPECIES: condensation domain-containing protein [unclassified Streptomyces]MDF3142960.1 condensation domain-containing protein [Streptomyces sp. T21Q-yed]WDF42887.1 condensation domain-containing protein [Streptomyces sp. T12]